MTHELKNILISALISAAGTATIAAFVFHGTLATLDERTKDLQTHLGDVDKLTSTANQVAAAAITSIDGLKREQELLQQTQTGLDQTVTKLANLPEDTKTRFDDLHIYLESRFGEVDRRLEERSAPQVKSKEGGGR